MLVDFFTKSLPKDDFKRLLLKIFGLPDSEENKTTNLNNSNNYIKLQGCVGESEPPTNKK